jgi:acetolactate synthase-1/2/3 large subunit
MTGAEYIAKFLEERGVKNIFLINGGACAFIVDAIGQNPNLKYTAFQHEQACAMAADAVFKVSGNVGVTVATSGPGATNLITGIACSYFDSIPSMHITGQVNQSETANFLGANVRQAGFQETKIVEMVQPITKYAVQVKTGKDLKRELIKAWNIAISDRKGPVLIDVPMNVQKEEVGDVIEYFLPEEENLANAEKIILEINNFLKGGERPLVLFGAGVGLSGANLEVESWLKKTAVPFVSSWNGMTYFSHDIPNFYGKIGVYGGREANFLIQNCDRLLVLGSRLDNRQRSGNPKKNFAISAKVMVLDVDKEELKKYKNEGYETIELNLKHFPKISNFLKIQYGVQWIEFANLLKSKYYCKNESKFAAKNNSISPYEIVKTINNYSAKDAIIISDIGAHMAFAFQMLHRTNQIIFTNGGHGAMGYALPAIVGSGLYSDKQIIGIIGDGCMQMNIQELQTIKHYGIKAKIFIFNNSGYGIIKQFQDLYFEKRYTATGVGYSVPNFEKIAEGYEVPYIKITNIGDLTEEVFNKHELCIFEIILHPHTEIEPKLELGKPIHDQAPYLADDEFQEYSKFSINTRKS